MKEEERDREEKFTLYPSPWRTRSLINNDFFFFLGSYLDCKLDAFTCA